MKHADCESTGCGGCDFERQRLLVLIFDEAVGNLKVAIYGFVTQWPHSHKPVLGRILEICSRESISDEHAKKLLDPIIKKIREGRFADTKSKQKEHGHHGDKNDAPARNL